MAILSFWLQDLKVERGKDYLIQGKTKLRFVVIIHSFLYKWNNGIKCVWPSGMSGIKNMWPEMDKS